MKTFIIGTQENVFRVAAHWIDISDCRIGFMRDNYLVAEFKTWEYWYEETSEEEKDCCCPCKQTRSH
jgi:hypothetical protein